MARYRAINPFLQAVLGPLILCAAGSVNAQLPLNIEEMLVQPATMKLEMGTAFGHIEEAVAVVGSNSRGVALALERRDLELAALTARLRYGLSSTVELSSGFRVDQLHMRQRAIADESQNSQVVDIGVNWLVSRDGQTPALLLQFGADVAGDAAPGAEERVYGGALRLAATVYRAMDPVVLSLAAGYEYRRRRSIGDLKLDPGDTAWVIPQINFAVNERVTLIGGFGVYFRQADELHALPRGERQTLTTLRLGSGVALGRHSTLFLGGDFAASGQRSARFALDWIYRF